jgi:uncharacterized glyoxalase superfamily protein PhnB
VALPSTSLGSDIPESPAAVLIASTGAGYWEELSASGTVTMPMQQQAWGDEFGMCVDQFGVPWLINIGQPRP